MTHRWTIAVIVTLAGLVTAVSSVYSTDRWQDKPVQTHYGRPFQTERFNFTRTTDRTTSLKLVIPPAKVQKISECQVPDLGVLWLHRLSNPQYCHLSQHEP